MFTPTLNAFRKLCNNCNFTGFLIHACKKVKIEVVNPSIHNMPSMNSSHFSSGQVGCLLCAFNIMSAYFNLLNVSTSSYCINTEKSMKKKRVTTKTTSPLKVKKKIQNSKLGDTLVNASKGMSPFKVELKLVKNYMFLGHELVWVPKKD